MPKKVNKEQSPYELMKESGKVRRGRRKAELNAKEVAEREERNREKNRQRQEARRRAHMVLEMKHKAEFDDLYRSELDAVAAERGEQ
jgi:hypothetical protein